MVSKIVKSSDANYSNELKISQVLKKIDPAKKYYITFDKYCYINNVPKERDDIISVHYTNESMTKFTKDAGQEGKDKKACDVELSMRPINFIMPFAGYSLSSVMKINRKASGTRAIMHNLFVNNLPVYFKHLILGIIKMHNNRIINHDIKQKNIMLNWDKELNQMIVRYIDFGLSNLLTKEFTSVPIGVVWKGDCAMAFVQRNIKNIDKYFILDKPFIKNL